MSVCYRRNCPYRIKDIRREAKKRQNNPRTRNIHSMRGISRGKVAVRQFSCCRISSLHGEGGRSSFVDNFQEKQNMMSGKTSESFTRGSTQNNQQVSEPALSTHSIK